MSHIEVLCTWLGRLFMTKNLSSAGRRHGSDKECISKTYAGRKTDVGIVASVVFGNLIRRLTSNEINSLEKVFVGGLSLVWF